MMQQPPVPLIRSNQIKATGDEDAAEEVIPEEAFIKDVGEEEEAPTSQYIYSRPGTSRENWRILARF